MGVEGESVRAFVEMPAEEKGIARIGAEKEDGTPVPRRGTPYFIDIQFLNLYLFGLLLPICQ